MTASIIGLLLLAVVAGGCLWVLSRPNTWRCPHCGRYHGADPDTDDGLIGIRPCPRCRKFN